MLPGLGLFEKPTHEPVPRERCLASLAWDPPGREPYLAEGKQPARMAAIVPNAEPSKRLLT